MQTLNWIWILYSLIYIALCIAADYLLYRRRKRKGKGWTDAFSSFSIPAVIAGIEFAVFSFSGTMNEVFFASGTLNEEMLSYQLIKLFLVNLCISLCGTIVNFILSHSKLRETFWVWFSMSIGITVCTGWFNIVIYLQLWSFSNCV